MRQGAHVTARTRQRLRREQFCSRNLAQGRGWRGRGAIFHPNLEEDIGSSYLSEYTAPEPPWEVCVQRSCSSSLVQKKEQLQLLLFPSAALIQFWGLDLLQEEQLSPLITPRQQVTGARAAVLQVIFPMHGFALVTHWRYIALPYRYINSALLQARGSRL